MTLQQLRAAIDKAADEWTPETDKLYKEARNACLEAGICFDCYINDGERKRVNLDKWEAGNRENYAGRECPECGEFYQCGEQPEYQDQATEWRGDADPGL